MMMAAFKTRACGVRFRFAASVVGPADIENETEIRWSNIGILDLIVQLSFEIRVFVIQLLK